MRLPLSGLVLLPLWSIAMAILSHILLIQSAGLHLGQFDLLLLLELSKDVALLIFISFYVFFQMLVSCSKEP